MSYKTIEACSLYGDYDVYEYGIYEKTSVLAGQQKRTFIDAFETIEEAKHYYPDAVLSNPQTCTNTYNHLTGSY